jgi:hypothetical protein
MDGKRRYKHIRVSNDLMPSFFTTGKKCFEVRGGLPPDAEFVDSQYDVFHGRMILRFRSDSFPEVPDGHMIPEVDLGIWRLEEADAPPATTPFLLRYRTPADREAYLASKVASGAVSPEVAASIRETWPAFDAEAADAPTVVGGRGDG